MKWYCSGMVGGIVVLLSWYCCAILVVLSWDCCGILVLFLCYSCAILLPAAALFLQRGRRARANDPQRERDPKRVEARATFSFLFFMCGVVCRVWCCGLFVCVVCSVWVVGCGLYWAVLLWGGFFSSALVGAGWNETRLFCSMARAQVGSTSHIFSWGRHLGRAQELELGR